MYLKNDICKLKKRANKSSDRPTTQPPTKRCFISFSNINKEGGPFHVKH